MDNKLNVIERNLLLDYSKNSKQYLDSEFDTLDKYINNLGITSEIGIKKYSDLYLSRNVNGSLLISKSLLAKGLIEIDQTEIILTFNITQKGKCYLNNNTFIS